jgi:O-antigen ligase
MLLYLGLMPALLYALILTMSRGGFLALLVGAWLIFRQSSRKALLVITACGIAIGGWSLMSDIQRDRYMSLVSSDTQQSASADGRIRGMKGEFRLGLNRPIFGHGLGTTPEVKAHFDGKTQAAHNIYAELLMETGIVGLALFVTFMTRVYRLSRSNLQRLTVPDGQQMPLASIQRLSRALVTIFWVYAVYGLNYYGLSQDYWYVFAGLCLATSVITSGLLPKQDVPDAEAADTVERAA